MHACMYVCMRVCMCVYVCVSMYVCLCMCVYVCIYVCIYVCMHACMHVCMCVRTYVCKYFLQSTHASICCVLLWKKSRISPLASLHMLAIPAHVAPCAMQGMQTLNQLRQIKVRVLGHDVPHLLKRLPDNTQDHGVVWAGLPLSGRNPQYNSSVHKWKHCQAALMAGAALWKAKARGLPWRGFGKTAFQPRCGIRTTMSQRPQYIPPSPADLHLARVS